MEARARLELARAQLAEIDLEERRGELVPVAEAQAEAEALFSEARTKLLGVPTRARQRMQHLTADDVRMLDELIREAMEAFADGGQ
jgi:phage terminase Nu1 subunit (DNA packaging protein)